MELLEGCPYSAAKNCFRLQHAKQPFSAERVGHCIADTWASSSCERTVPSQVCSRSIDFYDNNIPLLYLGGETTMWITTTSEPDCCQLNQLYTTCYIWIHHTTATHNYIPTVSQQRTDMAGLSDMWGGGLRKEKVRDQYTEESSKDHEERR